MMNKSNLRYAIIVIIVFLAVWSTILDFSRFADLNYDYDIYPSAILKRVNVILAAIIAWNVGPDGLSLKDSRRMKVIFMVICLAEGAFIMGWREVGVCLFALCQALLIVRNSTGLTRSLSNSSPLQKRHLLISSLVLLMMFIALLILFKPLISINKSIFIVCLYGFFLSASLWAGSANYIFGLFPKRNSGMAAVGVACFYCCDISVGLDAVLGAGLPWLTANSLIWVFYIPALVLLALSSYK